MKRTTAVTWVLALYAFIAQFSVNAVDLPHYDPASGFTCTTCHIAHISLGSTGYNNICQNCHRPGNPVAGKNPFTLADAADPFKTHSTAGNAKLHQTSHRWDGPDTVSAAGALPPIQAAMTTTGLRERSGNALACVRCHSPHFNTYGNFLRIANNQDQLCLDCHRSRNVQSHLQGSHPVSINYEAAATVKPGAFNTPPLNANPANPTSNLDARLTTTNRQILCSTCHGVHYTDSRSASVDGRDNFANLSSGDGHLLRTDRRGPPVLSGQPDQLNICTNCHAGKKNHNVKGQDIQCVDCHGAHVEYDRFDPTNSKGTNIYLIRRNVTRAGQPSQIFFRYTGSKREYVNPQGSGVCQGCHTVPPPGGDYPPQHASSDPKVCNTCHYHNGIYGSFSGACASCHGYPPITATIGGPTGLANPPTNASQSPGAHAIHAKNRAMTCNTCHNGYTGKPMPSNSIDISFAINPGNVPGFSGSYTGGSYTSTNALNTPYTWSGSVSTTGVNQSCTATYCHGNAMPGGDTTGSDRSPVWTSTTYRPATLTAAYCGKCHGFPPSSASGHPGGIVIPAGFPATASIGTTCSCHTNINTAGNSHDNMFVNPALHINGIMETPTGAHGFPYGGSAHKVAAGTAPWGNCTTCHANSAGGTYPVASGTPPNCQGCHVNGLKAPSGSSSCWDCHGASATDGLPNGTAFPNNNRSHSAHVGIAGANCAICHTGGGAGSATHGSGNRTAASEASVRVVFNALAGPSATWISGSRSCATSYCHGQGTPVWGGTLRSTTDQCAKCHSSTAAGAVTAATPFYGTSYPTKVTANTDAKVGAHTAHIASSDSLSAALNCSDCHGSVTLTAATHMNGSTSFAWSSLAQTGGLTPSYSVATGICANVYCHGARMPGGDTSGSNRTPTWNVAFLPATISAAACGSCHGFPPSAAAGHPAVTIPAGFPATASIGTTCSCHANINTAGNSYANIFVNKALHINGTLEVSAGGTCDACHGYPPAGAGFSGTHNNWSSARAEDYPGGGGAHTVPNHVSSKAKPGEGFANCNRCHDPADHTMSPIAFTPSKNIKVTINQNSRLEAVKQARYTSNRLDGNSHKTGTCSNISCHFGATPKWDPNH